MIDKEKVRNFWERRGEKFAVATEEMANLEPDKELQAAKIRLEKAAVLPRLKLDGQTDVLDLGAGYGQWALRFAPKVNSVTAIEFSHSMLSAGIEEAKRRQFDNIRFIHAPAEDYIPDRKYDLVFISGLFMYLNDDQGNAVAEHAARALESGGQLFLRESVSLLPDRHIIDNKWSGASQANYSAVYRLPREFVQMFEAQGCKLLETGYMFPDGSPLNKWRETRLKFFNFVKL